MLSQRFVSPLPTSTSFVLLQKRKRELAPGFFWMDEETGVFLSLMQGDKTTIGYFNWMKLKKKRKKRKKDYGEDEGHWENRRAHERASIGETAVAIFHHGYSRRVAGVIRLCHRYSFYSFNAEKFNSFYSKINEWPHCDFTKISHTQKFVVFQLVQISWNNLPIFSQCDSRQTWNSSKPQFNTCNQLCTRLLKTILKSCRKLELTTDNAKTWTNSRLVSWPVSTGHRSWSKVKAQTTCTRPQSSQLTPEKTLI